MTLFVCLFFILPPDNLTKSFAAQKLDKFLHFLDALDCTAKQKETSSLRQLDTCTWLFSTSEYKSWRDGNDSFLLLQGKGLTLIFWKGYVSNLLDLSWRW